MSLPSEDIRPSCGNYDPTNYQIIMKSTNFLNIPLTLLAIFIIIYKSSRAMNIYKWFLLLHVLVMSVSTIQLSLFILPYIIFPVWGGMALGLFSSWKIPGSLQFLSFMVVTALGNVTTIWLFYYRTQVVLPDGHFLKHSWRGRKVFLFILLLSNLACFLHISIFFGADLNLEAMKTEFDRNLPCKMSILFDERIYVLDPKAAKYLMTVFCILYASATGLVLLFSLTLVKYLLSEKVCYSLNTRRLQMALLKALSIQTFVAFLFLFIPNFVLLSIRGISINRRKIF